MSGCCDDKKEWREKLEERWTVFLIQRRSKGARYLWGLSLAALGVVATLFLRPYLGSSIISVNFACLVLAALIGGFGPALLAASLSGLALDYLVLTTPGIPFLNLSNLARFVVYLSIGSLVSFLTARLRRTVKLLEAAKNHAELETSRREKVLALVSHDLREPLGATKLSTELIKNDVAKHNLNSFKTHLQILESATGRMQRLVDDLLDANKIEANTFLVNPKPVCCTHLIETTYLAVTGLLKTKNISFCVSKFKENLFVSCDEDQILRVLYNLVSNAVKFSPSGSTIRLNIKVLGDKVLFSVIDEGAGIDESDLKKLFRVQWQARETAHLGTGLGLYIVKGIVEAHQGFLNISSKPGQGTSIVFSLSLAKSPFNQSPEASLSFKRQSSRSN